MKQVPVRYLLLLFAASLVATLLVQALNNRAIRAENPDNIPQNTRSLVYNSTVYSVDNYWYVNHMKNYLEHGRFTVDVSKDRYEVRRTPVYPVFFGLHYLLLGEANAYRCIPYTQALVLALAVVALFLAVFHFTGNMAAAWIAAVLYGLYPAVPVATSLTITEALSSELVCFCLYFLSRAFQENRYRYWVLAGVTFALATLCRPTIVFLSVSCAWLLFLANRRSWRNLLLKGMSFAAGALLLLAPWTVRNYRLTGDVIFLEKFYGDPMDYGMPNIHLRKWISCWINPADFTSESVSNAMRYNLMQASPLPADSLVDGILDRMPARAFEVNSRASVHAALTGMYAFYAGIFRQAGEAERQALEQKASRSIVALRDDFIRKAPLRYYVVRNGMFLKSVVFQSNASSLAFLDGYSGSLWKKLLKALLYVLSVASWLSLLLVFAWRRYIGYAGLALAFAGISVAATVVFLSYYEARYSMPLFPLLFGSLAIVAAELLVRWKERYIQ